MAQRTKLLQIRLTPEEQDMARQLGEAMHDPISRVSRRHLRELYRERFGDAPSAKGGE